MGGALPLLLATLANDLGDGYICQSLEQRLAFYDKQHVSLPQFFDLYAYGCPTAGRTAAGQRWTAMRSETPALQVADVSRSFGRAYYQSIVRHCARTNYQAHRQVLRVGDWSRERGGEFSPHRTHRDGRDVDLFVYRSARTLAPAQRTTAIDYDALFDLVSCLDDSGAVSVIFVDKSIIKGLRQTASWRTRRLRHQHLDTVLRHLPGHGDHLHVNFFELPSLIEGKNVAAVGGDPTSHRRPLKARH